VRFDVNVDPHHHYVCVRCGLVRDFTSKHLDALRVPNAVEAFGSVVNAQVEVRGICASCQGQDSEKEEGRAADARRARVTAQLSPRKRS